MTFGEKVSAIIESWASGDAGIFMVVHSDSWNQKGLAIKDSVGRNTTSAVW